MITPTCNELYLINWANTLEWRNQSLDDELHDNDCHIMDIVIADISGMDDPTVEEWKEFLTIMSNHNQLVTKFQCINYYKGWIINNQDSE